MINRAYWGGERTALEKLKREREGDREWKEKEGKMDNEKKREGRDGGRQFFLLDCECWLKSRDKSWFHLEACRPRVMTLPAFQFYAFWFWLWFWERLDLMGKQEFSNFTMVDINDFVMSALFLIDRLKGIAGYLFLFYIPFTHGSKGWISQKAH